MHNKAALTIGFALWLGRVTFDRLGRKDLISRGTPHRVFVPEPNGYSRAFVEAWGRMGFTLIV